MLKTEISLRGSLAIPDGFDDGYKAGHETGYSEGYDEGYSTCREELGDVYVPPVITGDCSYKFYYGKWDDYINFFGNKLKTENITNVQCMFDYCQSLEEIPFDLNFATTDTYVNVTSMLKRCYALKTVPRINNLRPYRVDEFFSDMRSVRYIDDNIFNNMDLGYVNDKSGSISGIFRGCYSLRKLPSLHALRPNNISSRSNHLYYALLSNGGYSLDEVLELPVLHTIASSSDDSFQYSSIGSLHRIKNFTFKTNNGIPISANWSGVRLDMSRCGYASGNDYKKILDYNSGITEDKRVYDAASYFALKDDPDWYTTNVAFCRYNHDSMVNTINSLPDTTAFLASNGGTNTITFNKKGGTSTIAGSADKLTEEEIAVAVAKGWTVTLTSVG